MEADWFDEACEMLVELRSPAAGWGYRPAGRVATEPTALAALALKAAGHEELRVRAAAEALTQRQHADGSLGPYEGLPGPGWPTALALRLWAALGGYDEPVRRATAWLLARRGLTQPPVARRVVGHDPSLVGWPWIEGTHAWLEPTALAIWALRAAGKGEHARVREGLRLIADRAVPSGGWNYGNRAVFGRALRPQPAPTGLALAALAGQACLSRVAAPALSWLERTLPGVTAPASLGWGILGMRAWGIEPPWAPNALRRSFERLTRRDPTPHELALLILAGAGGPP